MQSVHSTRPSIAPESATRAFLEAPHSAVPLSPAGDTSFLCLCVYRRSNKLGIACGRYRGYSSWGLPVPSPRLGASEGRLGLGTSDWALELRELLTLGESILAAQYTAIIPDHYFLVRRFGEHLTQREQDFASLLTLFDVYGCRRLKHILVSEIRPLDRAETYVKLVEELERRRRLPFSDLVGLIGSSPSVSWFSVGAEMIEVEVRVVWAVARPGSIRIEAVANGPSRWRFERLEEAVIIAAP